jgi:hypothetical protein
MIRFPTYASIRDALQLELIRRGGEAKPRDKDESGKTVYDSLAARFVLQPDHLAARVFEPNGRPRSKWENMVRFARNDLVKLRLLDRSVRGSWKLTPAAIARAQSETEERASEGDFQPGFTLSPEALARAQAQRKAIGDAGEQFVLNDERRRLLEASRGDLVSQIQHVAVKNVAAGYDIVSFEITGERRYIEVKATTRDEAPFFLSAHAKATAEHLGPRYWIYRVTNVFSEKTAVIRYHDPAKLLASRELELRPVHYEVLLTQPEDDSGELADDILDEEPPTTGP